MNEWGLTQAPPAPPSRTGPTLVGAAAGVAVGGALGYFFDPRHHAAMAATWGAMLGALGGTIGYLRGGQNRGA